MILNILKDNHNFLVLRGLGHNGWFHHKAILLAYLVPWRNVNEYTMCIIMECSAIVASEDEQQYLNGKIYIFSKTYLLN